MKTTTVVLLGGLCCAAVAHAAEFYVAPNGRDTNAGSRDRPLATLPAARDAARSGGVGPHRIVVLPGEYFLTKTLELDARDNGLTIEAETAGRATLYGGSLVTGWRRDGDRFWCVDLAGVRDGTWNFRAVVVNGRMPQRARMPETGTFQHQSVFDVRNLSSVGGGWERKPTRAELTTLRYAPGDIPPTFVARNAEVRVYHMWDESLCQVAANDSQRHTLTFATPARNPPGAFGIKTYVVFNTREGMTRPGQWYLDRAAGRLVYWPLAHEDMTRVRVIAPRLPCVVRIVGTAQRPAAGICLRGLTVQATTPQASSGHAFDGAISLHQVRDCAFERLEICYVGGNGIAGGKLAGCRITDGHVHHTGAAGIVLDGSATLVARNHIHHAGVYYPTAEGLVADNQGWRTGARGFRIQRNEVHDTPYCGIRARGGNHLIDENLIYRVMRELHDGAAIYGAMSQSVLRGNLVRDVRKIGEGYGASAFYFDEGSQDSVIERNVALGVEQPVHNHIARRCVIRDNVFVADADMLLSFERSRDGVFAGNTLLAPGKITVEQPGALKVWTGNAVFRAGRDAAGRTQAFLIDAARPPAATPPRRRALTVERLPQPPTLDGQIRLEEWPVRLLDLYRAPSRWEASGAPAFARLAYDDRCLYAAVNVTMFDFAKLASGATWGQDDGMEVCIAGQGPDGRATTFVVRGFAGGQWRSVTDAGASAGAAERLGRAVRFAARPYSEPYGDKRKSGWCGEWAIPWAALGLQPAPGLKLAFNLGVYRSEDQVWRCWEGTLAENWRVDEAGTMRLK